jgi:hypothetical protein
MWRRRLAQVDNSRFEIAETMTRIRKKTPAELEACKALVEEICASLKGSSAADRHAELSRRLYTVLGEIHVDDWPELFGRGGISGPSYLGTAYSGARLEHARHVARELQFAWRGANVRPVGGFQCT